jgi:hypothetical protein
MKPSGGHLSELADITAEYKGRQIQAAVSFIRPEIKNCVLFIEFLLCLLIE